RRKEDVDERLLKLPPGSLQVGRRGPLEAVEAAKRNGWAERLGHVDIPAELVGEAAKDLPDEPAPLADGQEAPVGVAALAKDLSPSEVALRTLRAGLSGARIAPEVVEALQVSPDPGVLVDRYLIAHRKSGAPDPLEVTKTLFFAHAGPMQKLTADDKLLLRHFRPVKTQKRGQLFYRLLEVIEERLNEKERESPHDLDARGLGEQEAMAAVRKVIVELNKDPNRYLLVTDEWLGEVTRRHLYFGSRTRKEGAAYKWYRKIGPKFFLGAHKTREELDERQARRAAKLADLPDDPDEDG
ncbi:MAG: hypothetical protein QOI63_887, partial [Thermoplasmata archaeon]|nr:hypothetical protein [Thermoplasmata archaeon]